MTAFFLKILNMSMLASNIILIVLLVRILLKKAPKIFSYLLWMIPFTKLILPFSFESILSITRVNQETIPSNISITSHPQINSGITLIDSTINAVLPPATSNTNPIQTLILIGTIIWLLGILTLFIHNTIQTLKFSRKLKQAAHIKDNIYAVKNLETAFVFGLFRPKIYLPSNLDDEARSYIILHEQIHLRRLDHITKFMAYIIAVIHWFNPLVWLSFYLLTTDIELSCDEAVIKAMGDNIKQSYSNSLLSLSADKKFLNATPIAFGENNTKQRIKNVLDYKKPKFWISSLVMILLVFVCIMLWSQRPHTPPDTSNPNEEPEISNISEIEIYLDQKQFVFPAGDTAYVIEDILDSMVKVGGIVDMAEPTHHISIHYTNTKTQELFLWLSDDHDTLGALMFAEDTHTAYSFDADLKVALYDVLYLRTFNYPEYLSISGNFYYFVSLTEFEELGSINEGSFFLKNDMLNFQITVSTGSTLGAMDGPRIKFEINPQTNEILSTEFTPAPDYDALGITEFSEFSNMEIILDDERIIEIKDYLIELIKLTS